MSCLISTGCFQNINLAEIVALACKHDFDLELSSSLSFSPTMLEPVFQAKSMVGFLIHNYFPPPAVPFVLNLASCDPYIHNRSVKLCQEAITLCAALGSPFYSVHAGFAMEMEPDMLGKPHLQGHAFGAETDRKKAYQLFVETIGKLAEFAAEKRVILLVENNVLAVENVASDGTFPFLLADVNEIRCFFNDLRRPDVGLLLDVGHAKVSAATLQVNAPSYFDELEPFIRCLHLSDNNGQRDSHSPFSSSSWFIPYLNRFEHASMVVEVYQCRLAEVLAQWNMVMNLLGKDTRVIGAALYGD